MLENDCSPSTDNTVYLKDYMPPAFLVEHVSLDFNLGHEFTLCTAELQLQRNGDHQHILCLDGENLDLLQVKLDGRELADSEFVRDETSLSIPDTPTQFSLQIQTRLQPHENTALSGLYQSSGNFCTQCEAEGFRRITYFPDRPDVLSVYQVKITADQTACPVLLSNGNPVEQGLNDDGTHWAIWHDPHPKPSYLFALVAGDLKSISDRFVTMSGRSVELNIVTQAHNIDQCQHAMNSLKASMQWDEQVYGREYDLDIYNVVAVDDFNMGAMENKGLNIFNSKYVLANQQTATDSDYEGIESVIGHEYFHNWSGNRVTCRDWFQLSLKEGFTVFRDQEFSADMGSRAVKRIRDVQALRTHQFKEDAGPMAHPVRPESYQEINNFYTVTIYEKGAEVIRMLYSIVGKHGFRKATDLYFERFDGQAVTTEDFVQCMEQANNVDLKQFRLWYTQAGTPVVKVEQRYDPDSKVFMLCFSQSCPATPGQSNKQPFYIPLKIALINAAGEQQLAETVLLTTEYQEIEYEGWSAVPTVSLLRGFSAPIKLEFAQSHEQLAHLIRYDTDGFARWEAVQRLFLNLLLPAINSGELDSSSYQHVLQALLGLIDSKPDDKAVFAEMLSLPSAAYIAEQCKPINAQRVFKQREQVKAKLAVDLQSRFLDLYNENKSDSEFSLGAAEMAQRALKNRALSYLLACEQSEFYELARRQYFEADNMTDRLAAFSALVHSTYPEKQQMIDDFYRQWRDHSLVLDKWFALQATVPTQDTLLSVQSLLKHSAFSIANPNKVRSLIGAYTANMPSFHNQDGSGYRFLADKIIQLNSLNPQIAARLSTSFNHWRAYAEPQSSLMKAELERINEQPELSRDLREIVSKALS